MMATMKLKQRKPRYLTGLEKKIVADLLMDGAKAGTIANQFGVNINQVIKIRRGLTLN